MDHIGKIIKGLDTDKIIREANTEASSSPESNCPICRGNEWLHPIENGVARYDKVVPCSCKRQELKERRVELLLDACRFPLGADHMTIEGFKPTEGTKVGYNMAAEMARNPGTVRWLALIGSNGTGKSHLGISICKKWVAAGVPARYVLTSLLLDELREGFKRADDDSYAARFHYYCTVPLLMLDDLGIESRTGWVQEKLETIVDTRLMNGLSLIVTSNQTLDQMQPRIRSRLMRIGEIVHMNEKDYSLRRFK